MAGSRTAASILRRGALLRWEHAGRRALAASTVLALVLSLALTPLASAGTAAPDATGDSAGAALTAMRHAVLPGPAPIQPTEVAPLADDVLLTDGFETGMGSWSLYPGSTAGWGQTSYRASEGTYSAYCVASGIPAPGPYVNDMDAWMVAGPFDLSTYTAATLSWDMWVDTESGWDYLWFGASADGSNFDMWGQDGYTAGWVTGNNINLADFYGDGTVDFTSDSSVWIAFYFETDDSSSDYEGAYVDNVRLVAGQTAPDNTAPVAVADTYATDQDVELNVNAPGVLGNDSDAESDPLWAELVNDVDHGALYLDSDGSFTYEPNPGWHGTDVFSYKADDGEFYSNTVNVTITVNEGEAPLPPVLYVAGNDRFETAVEASKLAYPNGASTVVIATGRNWPDALGGSALAGVLDGPILLTEPGSLPPSTLGEIQRLGATHAVILGGTAAVGTGVETALKNAVGSVERIAGDERYDTANKVARRVITELGGAYSGSAFVATGGNFPDALAAAPLAAANGWPLFLSNPTTGISSATHSAMAGVADVVIFGGTAAISDAVEANLNNWGYGTWRIAGATRYDTAAEVAEYGVGIAGLGWNRVGIATGENYPDALAGGVLQGKVGSVMLLTLTSSLSNEAGYALLNNRQDISTVTFFGGTAAVSQATRNDVLAAIAGTWTPDEPPPTGTDGVWHGIIDSTTTEGVTFNVKNNMITGTGSTLEYGASMIVVYPYYNATMTVYVYDDIPIVNGSFSYTSGSASLIGGQKHVEGTITSSTQASGSASHVEHSISIDGELEYDWTATR